MRQCINRAPISGARVNNDSTMGGTNMKYSKRTALVAVILAVLALPAVANAATKHVQTHAASSSRLHPVIPVGLPTNNINAAVLMIKQRAGYDPSFASTIAQNAGTTKFDPSQYQPFGYSMGAPNTVNTGATTSGDIQKSQDTTECNSKTSTMAVMINVVTHVKVYVCTACANPRIYSSQPAPYHPWATFKKDTYIKYDRTKTQRMSITCPSGQVVYAVIRAHIHGVLHATVYGKVQGTLDAQLKAEFNGQLKVTTTLKCGAAPAVPKVVPPTTCVAINSPGAVVCGTVTYVNVCGTQVIYTGSPSDIQTWTNTYIHDHCQPTVTTTVTCNENGATNYGSPGPCVFPPQSCQDHSANNYGGPLPCTFAPTIVITLDTINDIPSGKCRPEAIHVHASEAGQIMVSPTKGMISTVDCYQASSARQSTVTLSVGAGDSTQTVYVYAPAESSATSDTLTVTPLFSGYDSGKTVHTDYAISQPVRS